MVYDVQLEDNSLNLGLGDYVLTNELVVAELIEDPREDGIVSVVETDFQIEEIENLGAAVRI